MNLILKIVQGPNAGAEAALLEGVNLKIGKGDECDLILSDQTLPDVACELEVSADGVTMLLPDGKKAQMQPFCVKVFETTAIAIGPAEGAWQELKWPVPGEEDNEEPEKAPRVPMSRAKKLQIALLVFFVLVICLEFALWFFWPYLNGKMVSIRTWCRDKYAQMTVNKLELAAIPIHKRTLKELAMVFKVRVKNTEPDGKPIMYGNLSTRENRLRLTAQAYSVCPGIQLELTDDETMQASVQELVNMLAGPSLKIVSMKNRELVLGGSIDDLAELTKVLEAIKADIPHLEKIDCSTVSAKVPAGAVIPASRSRLVIRKSPVKQSNVKKAPAKKAEIVPEPEKISQQPVPKAASGLKKLPIVGVLTRPYPCLVLRNGTRVMEGAEFFGYVVERINDDVIILRNGDISFEWRP